MGRKISDWFFREKQNEFKRIKRTILFDFGGKKRETEGKKPPKQSGKKVGERGGESGGWFAPQGEFFRGPHCPPGGAGAGWRGPKGKERKKGDGQKGPKGPRGDFEFF